MEFALLVISLPFFMLAVTLSKGKGASFLAGYNTMPDSEKAQYDEVALCKFMGKIMYGITFSIVLLSVSEMLDNRVIFMVGLLLLLAFIIFASVYANTSNRFKKHSY